MTFASQVDRHVDTEHTTFPRSVSRSWPLPPIIASRPALDLCGSCNLLEDPLEAGMRTGSTPADMTLTAVAPS